MEVIPPAYLTDQFLSKIPCHAEVKLCHWKFVPAESKTWTEEEEKYADFFVWLA